MKLRVLLLPALLLGGAGAASARELEAPPGAFSAPAKDGAEVLFRQARDLRFAQRWYAAAELYRKLLKDYPDSSRTAEARFWLASSLEQDQRWDEAAEAYTDFLTRHPDQRLLGKEARLNRVHCWGVRQWDSPEAFQGLAQSLSEEQEEVRVAAALQLAKRRDRRAVPVLQQGLAMAGCTESCRLALVAMDVKPEVAAPAARFLVVRIQEKGKDDVVTVRVSAALARAVTSYISDEQLREARAKGVDVDRILDQALTAPKGSELFSLDDKQSRVTVTVE